MAIPVSCRCKRIALLSLSTLVSIVGCSRSEPLPKGYAVFFASSSEASLVKPATMGGEVIVGPHVAELGSTRNTIYGRIDPKQGLPPHPDHAPGYFLINVVSGKVTTGLDRERWHEGTPVTSGWKYVLRTDVFYKQPVE